VSSVGSFFSSGRLLYKELCYSTSYNSVPNTLFYLQDAHTDACKHTIAYLYVQPPSWRWTFGF